MGFWLFAGIEVVYAIFFILIVVFASMAFSSAKDGQKASTDPKEQANYQKAIDLLAWCLGLGWALIGLGVLAIIIAAVAAFFAAPEGAAAGAAAGSSELLSTSALLSRASQFKSMLTVSNFNKLEKVLNFVGANKGHIYGLDQKTDKLYSALEQEKNGFLWYNKIFGMSGVFGTIEKVILWTTAALLFGVSVTAAAAAGYIGRTSSKEGYDSAITSALIGIFPFAIMVIWAITNAVWIHYKTKEVEAVENEIISPSPASPVSPVSPRKQQQPYQQRLTPTRPTARSSPARQQAPPPMQRAPPPPPYVVAPAGAGIAGGAAVMVAAPPHHHRDIHPPDSDDIPTQHSMDNIMYKVKHQSAKTTAEQGVSIAQTVVGHADQAHKILSSLKGTVDPNSSHGQLLSNATDILATIKSHKDTVDSIGRAVKAY